MDARTAFDERDQLFLLDIREMFEWDAGRIEGSVHIPMMTLSARREELPVDRPILVICRSGNRSAHMTSMLKLSGLDAHNLEGGVKAWVAAGLEAFTTPDGRPGRIA